MHDAKNNRRSIKESKTEVIMKVYKMILGDDRIKLCMWAGKINSVFFYTGKELCRKWVTIESLAIFQFHPFLIHVHRNDSFIYRQTNGVLLRWARYNCHWLYSSQKRNQDQSELHLKRWFFCQNRHLLWVDYRQYFPVLFKHIHNLIRLAKG